jgi:hypothetical protein
MVPSLTASAVTGAASCALASSSSTRRASADTRRATRPSVSTASEPPDPPWSGVMSELPMTSFVRS